MDENTHFTPRAKEVFLASVDYKLIAYAKAFGDTVITFEASEPDRKNKVKIPDACKALDVPCIRIWDMMSARNACFTLTANEKNQPFKLSYVEEGRRPATA